MDIVSLFPLPLPCAVPIRDDDQTENTQKRAIRNLASSVNPSKRREYYNKVISERVDGKCGIADRKFRI